MGDRNLKQPTETTPKGTDIRTESAKKEISNSNGTVARNYAGVVNVKNAPVSKTQSGKGKLKLAMKPSKKSISEGSMTPQPKKNGDERKARSRADYPPYKKKKHHYDRHSDSPYPRNSDGYKKFSSLSSDEAKRKRLEEERQRKLEARAVKSFSPECYLGVWIVTLISLIVIFSFMMYTINVPAPKDTINLTRNYAVDVARVSMLVMSDNLDCSLYMKRQTMQLVDLREVALAGLQCLFINEPHSVAPDAGISMLSYYHQDRGSILRNLNLGYIDKELSKKCIMGAKDTFECDQHSFRLYYSSFVDLSPSNFTYKDIHSPWMRNCAQKYHERYRHVFRKLARFEDGGKADFGVAARTQNYNSSNTNTWPGTRVFVPSRLLERTLKLAKHRKRLFSSQYSALFNVTPSTTRKNRFLVTKNLTRYVVHHFLHCKTKKKTVPRPKTRLRLHSLTTEHNVVPHLLYPNGSTHSIFAAFVYKTVYEAVVRKVKEKQYEEIQWWPEIWELYVWSMRAQRLAMHYFVHSREWTGNPRDLSMFSRVRLAAKRLFQKLPDGLYQPMRKKVDRSASLVIWARNNSDEIQIVNSALPSLFGSNHIRGRPRSNFSHFEVTIKGKESRSVPFMSATSLILLEELDGDPDSSNPQHVVTSSGSVRNVEAASMTLLLSTIMGLHPGNVTSMPSIYLDVRDGKFYCDHFYYINKDAGFQRYAKELYGKVQEEGDEKCEPLKKTDFLAKDRIVMIASRPNKRNSYQHQQSRNTNKYMRASIDPRILDYNYPAGF